jgi:ligand-binding sensor domain-containing protein/signal transduction histidine kinase
VQGLLLSFSKSAMKKVRTKVAIKIFVWVLLDVLCLISPNLYGEKDTIRFRRIFLEEGLSQSSVLCINQDNRGFMWFGTADGLNRYDGYNFKIFRPDPQDQTTISDRCVLCIHKSSSGIFWIGTEDGLNKFDTNTEKFKQYRHVDGDPESLRNNLVKCIQEEGSRILWIGTDGGGLNRFDQKTKKFKQYRHVDGDPESLSHDIVNCIMIDRSGILWVGTADGLNKFDTNTEKFKQYRHVKWNSRSSSHNRINCILEDQFGVLWIGTDGGGLNSFDPQKEQFKAHKNDLEKQGGNFGDDRVMTILGPIKGELLIGTHDGGLSWFNINIEDRKFTHGAHHDPSDPNSLSCNDVRAIYEDCFGLFWIGTLAGGVNIFNPNIRFKLYSTRDVRVIYEDNSSVRWIGTSNGLEKFDRTSGGFTPFKYDAYDRYSLSDSTVTSIYEDRFNKLWIGTQNGVNILDRNTEKFINHRNKRDFGLKNKKISSILEDRKGDIWIGTFGDGIRKFDQDKRRFTTHFSYQENKNQSLSDDRVTQIYKDRYGELWIGTYGGGLNKFDQSNGMFFSYKTNKNPGSLSNDRIQSICEDSNGNLWIGTYNGLNKMNRKTGKFEVFHEEDGLPSDVIYGILGDNRGVIWISTVQGLSSFNIKTRTFKNYDLDEDLQGNEFYRGAYCKSKEGEMLFGSINGFYAFFPTDMKDDTEMPKLAFTDFLIENQSVLLKKPIYVTDSLELPYKIKFFSFEFAALHYSNPKKNRYKYKLEGFDEEWIETDYKNRRATYTNISGGEYVFRVKGSNKDGVWSKEGASIRIKIPPSPWETWWAWTLYCLAAIVILFLLGYAWYARVLKKQVRERTKELLDTQRKLAQSEKLKALGVLVARVAHEFNNPASFIRTTSYNLSRDLQRLKMFLIELAGDEADGEILSTFDEKFDMLFKHLAILKGGSIRISDIVRSLRTLSPMGLGDMEWIDLNEGLNITVSKIKHHYIEQVDFVTIFQPGIEIKGSLDELDRVFRNIIQNACQAIQLKQKNNINNFKGILTIRTCKEKDHAVISFQDTGIGISDDVRKKMFDPFFTTRPEGEGWGLGLYISYDIIQKHGGQIKVESEVGRGTTITLCLPLSKKALKVKEIT